MGIVGVVLVCLGGAKLLLTSLHIGRRFPGPKSSDRSRLFLVIEEMDHRPWLLDVQNADQYYNS